MTFNSEQQLALLEATKDVRDKFVRPLYLSLLHGNFIWRRSGRTEASAQQILELAQTISDEQIERLLEVQEWRGRLTAAWFIGLTRRHSFVQKIGDLLQESKQVFSGQGYCVALGLIASDACQIHLLNYLCEYLPLRGRIYDQTWAIGALTHIEGAAPDKFLDKTLWEDRGITLDPIRGIQNFGELIIFLKENNMI